MNLEQQVCSLKLAKRLKELGVPQDSLFYWDSHAVDKIQDGYGITSDGEFSAFTVAELGEMLPESIVVRTIGSSELKPISEQHGGRYYFYFQKGMGCFYAMNNGQTRLYTRYLSKETEADARAKMLIYLLENNLMKLES